MKWVLLIGGGLLGLLLVAAVVLFALGFRQGAGRVSGAVEIAAPPERLWPWIVEADSLRQWVGWLTEVHDLTPGQQGVGARTKWVLIDPTMNNQRVEITGEYIVWEPGRVSGMHLESPGMFSGRATYRLTGLDGPRTRLEYTSEFEFLTWFARLFEPIVTPQARKKAMDDMHRLKRLAEAGTVTVPQT